MHSTRLLAILLTPAMLSVKAINSSISDSGAVIGHPHDAIIYNGYAYCLRYLAKLEEILMEVEKLKTLKDSMTRRGG